MAACIYAYYLNDRQTVPQKTFGFVQETRRATIDYLKGKIPSLLSIKDHDFLYFYIDDVHLSDESDLWKAAIDLYSATPGFTITLRIQTDEKPIIIKDEEEEVASIPKKRKVNEVEEKDEEEEVERARETSRADEEAEVIPEQKKVKQKAEPVDPSKVVFKIALDDGSEMLISVRKTKPLRKVFEFVATKLRICRFDVRLVHDGTPIGPNQTPEQLGIQDGDKVDFVKGLKGGKPVIYVYPPELMDVTCRLSLSSDWSFSAVYPQVEEKLLADGGQSVLWRARVEKNGDMRMLGGLSSDGNVEEGLEVSYLYWEALTNSTRPASPPSSPRLLPTSSVITTPPFNPCTASLCRTDTVLLPTSQVTSYLDKALKALGLHVEGRTSFITYWLPSFLKHPHLLLRFVPQESYSQAAPLELTPPADVTTRIFLLFQGVLESEASEAKWSSARLQGEAKEFESWREIVGVASKERQEDASLLRVVEWGGMEVLSR